ncbi:hypothetical protein LTR60_004890, partial [Cryomyces antarcticus]
AKELGLTVGGKKADLVQRLATALATRAPTDPDTATNARASTPREETSGPSQNLGHATTTQSQGLKIELTPRKPSGAEENHNQPIARGGSVSRGLIREPTNQTPNQASDEIESDVRAVDLPLAFEKRDFDVRPKASLLSSSRLSHNRQVPLHHAVDPGCETRLCAQRGLLPGSPDMGRERREDISMQVKLQDSAALHITKKRKLKLHILQKPTHLSSVQGSHACPAPVLEGTVSDTGTSASAKNGYDASCRENMLRKAVQIPSWPVGQDQRTAIDRLCLVFALVATRTSHLGWSSLLLVEQGGFVDSNFAKFPASYTPEEFLRLLSSISRDFYLASISSFYHLCNIEFIGQRTLQYTQMHDPLNVRLDFRPWYYGRLAERNQAVHKTKAWIGEHLWRVLLSARGIEPSSRLNRHGFCFPHIDLRLIADPDFPGQWEVAERFWTTKIYAMVSGLGGTFESMLDSPNDQQLVECVPILPKGSQAALLVDGAAGDYADIWKVTLKNSMIHYILGHTGEIIDHLRRDWAAYISH